MKKLLCLETIVILFLFFGIRVGHLWAHGVEYQIDPGGLTITVWYEGLKSTPMSNAFVKVFAPGENAEFQKGRTDRNGRFSFFPDRPGKWTITINDEHGHGVVAEVVVDEELKPLSQTQSLLPIYLKLLIGVSVIFGIFGLVSFLVNWKKNRFKQ